MMIIMYMVYDNNNNNNNNSNNNNKNDIENNNNDDINNNVNDDRETLTELEAHLHKLEEDLKNKQLALSLDLRFFCYVQLHFLQSSRFNF